MSAGLPLWALLALVGSGVGPGSVGGRIVSAIDGAAIEGATVSIDTLGIRAGSDRDGRYRLEPVPPGRWTVTVDAVGYAGRSVIVRIPDDGVVSVDFELAESPPPDRRGRVVGTVREQGRLEPVRFATVEVVGLGVGTVSDENGLFSLDGVPEGGRTIRAEAPGYRDGRVSVAVQADGVTRVGVLLVPDPVVLPEVLVAGTRSVGRPDPEAPDAVVIDSVFLHLVPAVVERDVLRALQALPSTTPSSDFSAAPFVRGGTPDQTRIFLDGAPIYNPFHIGGFASAFSPSAVAATVLRPGGLPASAPSALAGVLEVQARDGGRDSVRVSGSVGLLSADATVDGPWAGGRASYLISARHTYADLATGAASAVGLIDQGLPYGFSDVHAKVTHDLGRAASLSVTGYLNREAFETDTHDGRGGWGNDLVAARVVGFLGDGIRSELGAGTSAFSGSYVRPRVVDAFGNTELASRLQAGLRTWFLDGRITRGAGDHTLWLGGRWEITRYAHDFDPGPADRDWIPPLHVSGSYGPLALFARDLWRVAGPLELDGGIRLERPRDRGWYVQPRGRVTLGGTSGSVSLAGGRYVQDRWSLRNEESVIASIAGYDLPIATPEGLPPQDGWDVVLEARRSIGGLSVRGDAYVKRIRGLPTPRPSAEPVDAPLVLPPDSIPVGRLDVEGLEISASGRAGGTSVSLGYRWQRETRRVEETSFTPRTNRPHRVVALIGRRLGERQAALSITWMSGLRFTPPLTSVPRLGGIAAGGRLYPPGPGDNEGLVALSRPNSAALPSYLRIDVDVRGRWDWTLFGRRGVLEPYVSVLNVLNNRNVLFSEEERSYSGPLLRRTFGPQLPVLPTFGLRFRF